MPMNYILGLGDIIEKHLNILFIDWALRVVTQGITQEFLSPGCSQGQPKISSHLRQNAKCYLMMCQCLLLPLSSSIACSLPLYFFWLFPFPIQGVEGGKQVGREVFHSFSFPCIWTSHDCTLSLWCTVKEQSRTAERTLNGARGTLSHLRVWEEHCLLIFRYPISANRVTTWRREASESGKKCNCKSETFVRSLKNKCALTKTSKEGSCKLLAILTLMFRLKQVSCKHKKLTISHVILF